MRKGFYMMQRFLAALDGSKASESILPYLEALLGTQDADVTLAHVIPDISPAKVQKAYTYLNRAAKDLRDKGAVVDVHVLTGKPASALVEMAANGRYSMILMCSRGRKGLRRLILGSVAEEVLRHATVPVLIVHPQDKPGAKPVIKRIVVPLDGSHRSSSILPHAATLAKATGARLLFMTTVEPRAHPDYPVEILAKNLFRDQKKLHKQGIPTELSIRYGDPKTEILAYGAVQNADLLALATHGRTGMERALYGSVAESVLREGRLPMLVVRSAGKFESDPLHAPAIRVQREKQRTAEAKAGFNV